LSGSERHQNAGPELRELFQRLAGAASHAPDPAAALGALARLDPSAALAWLGANEEAARREIPGPALGPIVSVAVELAAGGAGGAGEGSEPLAAAARFCDLVTPEAALAAARSPAAARDPQAARALVEQVLARVPRHVGLLRQAADLATRAGDAPSAHQRLSELARADGGQATVHRVYRQRQKLAAGDEPPVRIALLSSFTVDALVPYVDLEVRALGLRPEIQVAPFNSWAREVIDPGSALRAFAPEIAFLSVAADDLVPALRGAPPGEELAEAGARAVEQILAVARSYAEWTEAPLVVHGLHSAYRDPAGILAGREAPARAQLLRDWNARLAEGLAPLPHAFLLDMEELLAHRPEGPADNPKMRHLAAMRLPDRVCGEVARAYARYVAPLKGRTRKCVVVDLDGTLWGGVVGEDGPHGIQLGDTSPGVEYQDLQHFLRALSQQGVLLAVASKNNPEDALEVIRGHAGMVLREDDFSSLRIHWRPKTESLEEIARELDIGIDSLVFLDDNPNERERVRQFLPQVLVPELPADPALYRRTVEALPELQRLVATAEDRARVALYRAKRQREGARVEARSVEDYLQSLEIEVEIGPVDEASLGRVQQLFQRTNQFNLTTRRYDAGELRAFAESDRHRLYTLRARDRFGDHGLVAVALVRTEEDAWLVDSFLMSCRVIGYGVETALLAALCEDAWAAGVPALVGEFQATRKNAPASDFYSRHGFAGEVEGSSEEGVARFRRDLAAGLVESPPWVKVTRAHAA
jgi:FkbH-like protein